LTQWHFVKCNIFTGKVAWNSYLTHGLRHNCVIDQSATENKVIHTLIIDFFSHGLRSVKIEQELEKYISTSLITSDCVHSIPQTVSIHLHPVLMLDSHGNQFRYASAETFQTATCAQTPKIKYFRKHFEKAYYFYTAFQICFRSLF
jgi:hypothetical protein